MTNSRNHNNPYAVVIGGANMDICGAAKTSLKMKDSNPGEINMSPGGVARNIAENLALLKYDCHLFTAIGNDDIGLSLIKHSKDVGINMDKTLIAVDKKTSTYFSILDAAGEMVLAVNDMSIIDYITPEYLKSHEELIINSNIIIVDTNISEETLSYLINQYSEIPIIVDTVSAVKAIKIKKNMSGIHTLKTNRIEAEALSGMTNDLDKIAIWFHSQGVIKVFITLGEDGVFYSDEQGNGIITPQKMHNNVVNVTGAGDAFTAGIAYALQKEWDTKKIVHFGMAAATIALKHSNTINPEMSVERINKIMENKYDN